jgi:hypothetical protein
MTSTEISGAIETPDAGAIGQAEAPAHSGHTKEAIPIAARSIVAIPAEVERYIDTILRPILGFKEYKVSESKPLSGGSVTSVMTTNDGNNYALKAWVWSSHGNIQHFLSSDSLFRFLSGNEATRVDRITFLFERIFRLEVISGSIAIVLSLAIVVSAVVYGGHIDPILANALSVILAFYFGRESRHLKD